MISEGIEITDEDLAAITDQQRRYPVTIAWSEQYERYIASVPDLPGCIADGPTYEGAAAAARETMRLWLYVARMEGRAIPQPSMATAA